MFLLDSQCNKCRFTLSIKLQGFFLAGRIKNVFVHPPLFIYLFIHFSTQTCWCETAGQHSVSASLSGPQLVPIDFFVFLFFVFCIFCLHFTLDCRFSSGHIRKVNKLQTNLCRCQFCRITITFFGHTDSSQNTQAELLLLPCLHHRDRAFIIGMNKSFEWMSQDLMKNAFVFRQRSLPPLYFFAAREELIYFCIANVAASEGWLH